MAKKKKFREWYEEDAEFGDSRRSKSEYKQRDKRKSDIKEARRQKNRQKDALFTD